MAKKLVHLSRAELGQMAEQSAFELERIGKALEQQGIEPPAPLRGFMDIVKERRLVTKGWRLIT